ncbi:MAG: isochorismate synthase [Chloroflexi bacterium]|nr:isochorismate synthase [Chloroflexota bacterium]
MAIATDFIIDYSKIAFLFAAGVRQAKRTGRTTLVSYSQPLPEVDPLAFFAERQQTGVNTFYWEHPSDKFAMAGAGTAFLITGEGEQRFEATQEEWRKLLEEAITGGVDAWGVGPVLMGGFSFDPDRPTTELWRGYGESLLVLPRLLLTRKADHCFLTVNALLNPDSDATTLARQVALLYHQPPKYSFNATSNSLSLKDVRPAEEWKALVSQAVQRICEGDFEKVVLAREVRAFAQTAFQAGTILDRLRQNFPDATVFAIAREGRAFVGATPERLVQLQHGEVRTVALAGSIARGSTPEEDTRLGNELLHSDKNQGEHALVIDLIQEALKKVCSTLYIGEPPSLLKLRNVQHLYTPIIGRLREHSTILKLVEVLHPTPALGGYPRNEALQFIRENEGLDRGWYGAPVGWLDRRGEGEFVVAIRSALLDGGSATLFAGCGIVADSEPDSEYQESCVKLRAMLSALEG